MGSSLSCPCHISASSGFNDKENVSVDGLSARSANAEKYTDEFGVDHTVKRSSVKADGYGSASDSDNESDIELKEEPAHSEATKNAIFSRNVLGRAVFCTKFGDWNRRLDSEFEAPDIPKSQSQMIIIEEVIQTDSLFRAAVDLRREEMMAKAFSIRTYKAGEIVVKEDPHAWAEGFYIVLQGSLQTTKTTTGKPAQELHPGGYIGAEALLWYSTWKLTATAGKKGCTVGSLSRSLWHRAVITETYKEVQRRILCMKQCKIFETFSDEELRKMVTILTSRFFRKGSIICRTGQMGHHVFIIESGEVAELKGDKNPELVTVYTEGDMVGQEALYAAHPRKATLRCETDVEVLVLGRRKFERIKGSLKDLLQKQSLTDPRKVLSDFFQAGTHHGPKGAVHHHSKSMGKHPDHLYAGCNKRTKWFVVFRPTSRDAIAKMVSGQGVGKGLNIKGKSAKKGILSAFVPFLQIHDNDHKDKIEASPPDSYVKVFYRSAYSRSEALNALHIVHIEQKEHLHYEKPYEQIDFEDLVTVLDNCEGVYGLRMPEVLLHEAYIELEDLRPHAGWETGRKSEPAYMDMNLHSIRDHSTLPECVLWQFDEGHPMNGHGLLLAYEEQGKVNPVVSDFDTFTVGSRHMPYTPLSEEQIGLAKWSLEETEKILRDPQSLSWSERWLDVLHTLAEKGQHHDFPPYGYGDDESVKLIKVKVAATKDSGAIRHGAECFNFHFPQELDEEFLVIWEGLHPESWVYLEEPQLREFLMARANEGYSFPVNPVWPVRDRGWYDILQVLRAHPEANEHFVNWFHPDSGLLDHIDRLHSEFPKGFRLKGQVSRVAESCADAREAAEAGLHSAKGKAQGKEKRLKRLRVRDHEQICEISGNTVNMRLQALGNDSLKKLQGLGDDSLKKLQGLGDDSLRAMVSLRSNASKKLTHGMSNPLGNFTSVLSGSSTSTGRSPSNASSKNARKE